ncbi:MAG: alpha-L-fucosidase [Armatimonadetes bacterium]|nr:alpha-L-fucosidase [Armatimonadota bacterium]
MSQMTPEEVEKDRARRLKWFREARFGMFIHWGLYARLGRHEWVMNRERIPVEEYEKLADTWKPGEWPARTWAKLAKKAGMRYMVMTTKHHEGFCLFDSALTDYNAKKRGPGRDLVAEYVEAARAEGLRVGFYYSMMDWHHPDGARCKHDEQARRRFVGYIHGQVRELCTNYGKLDIMWYDVSWPLDAEGWESAKMNAMVRQLQPDIIINDRSQLPEDFGTPEQHITPASGGRAWEACMTFNESWGYTPIDTNYKSAWNVVGMLRQVAAGGGNLLLNIGPTPEGGVPVECSTALEEVGEWMSQYGPAIYEATDPMQQEWFITGAFTAKGDTAYFHCNRWPGEEMAIGGLVNKVVSARFMGGKPIEFKQVKDRLVLMGLPSQAPDPLATVIELKVEDTPRQVLGAGHVIIENDPWAKTDK